MTTWQTLVLAGGLLACFLILTIGIVIILHHELHR